MLGERDERDTTQRPEPSNATSAPAGHDSNNEPGRNEALVAIAMICLVSLLVALLLQAYGVVFRQLGSYGLGAVAVFLVPIALGGVHLWRRGSFDA